MTNQFQLCENIQLFKPMSSVVQTILISSFWYVPEVILLFRGVIIPKFRWVLVLFTKYFCAITAQIWSANPSVKKYLYSFGLQEASIINKPEGQGQLVVAAFWGGLYMNLE